MLSPVGTEVAHITNYIPKGRESFPGIESERCTESRESFFHGNCGLVTLRRAERKETDPKGQPVTR